MIDAGLPAGVVNIVFGTGPKTGQAIVTHPQIPLISFTGGTATGSHIIASSAPFFKKLSLELGGKNPTIVFADCDMELALTGSTLAGFANQGEICLCGSRLLVEKSIYRTFVDAFVERVKTLKVGPGTVAENRVGPLVSEQHMNKVLSYIEFAKQDSSLKILCGGERVHVENHESGYFVAPTVIEGYSFFLWYDTHG